MPPPASSPPLPRRCWMSHRPSLPPPAVLPRPRSQQAPSAPRPPHPPPRPRQTPPPPPPLPPAGRRPPPRAPGTSPERPAVPRAARRAAPPPRTAPRAPRRGGRLGVSGTPPAPPGGTASRGGRTGCAPRTLRGRRRSGQVSGVRAEDNTSGGIISGGTRTCDPAARGGGELVLLLRRRLLQQRKLLQQPPALLRPPRPRRRDGRRRVVRVALRPPLRLRQRRLRLGQPCRLPRRVPLSRLQRPRELRLPLPSRDQAVPQPGCLLVPRQQLRPQRLRRLAAPLQLLPAHPELGPRRRRVPPRLLSLRRRPRRLLQRPHLQLGPGALRRLRARLQLLRGGVGQGRARGAAS